MNNQQYLYRFILQPLSAVKSWDMMNGNTNDTTIRAQKIIIGTKLAQHTKVCTFLKPLSICSVVTSRRGWGSGQVSSNKCL